MIFIAKMDKQNILEVRIDEKRVFQKILKKLKYVDIEDGSLIFKPVSRTSQYGGIYLSMLSSCKSILIKITFTANKFDYYKCTEEMTFNICTKLFLKYMTESMDSNLTLFVSRDNPSVLCVDNNKNIISDDINIFSFIPIPRTTFENKITLTSKELKKIYTNLSDKSNRLNQFITIYNTKNEITFKNEDGDNYSYIDQTYSAPKKIIEDIKLTFELKNLSAFSNCCGLCSTVELYLRNDFPMVQVISTIYGKICVCFAPLETYEV
jgi:hypothetical protein